MLKSIFMKKSNNKLRLKAFVLFAIQLITISTSYSMNPLIWGQDVFRLLQSSQSEKLIDYLYVSKEQMKTAILDAMKTRGLQGELVKKYRKKVSVDSKVALEYKNIRGVKGIIVRSWNCNFGDTIMVYNDKNQITQFIIQKEESEILALDCLDITEKFYKVRLESGEIGFLEVSSGKVIFNTFEEHILNLFSIGFESENPPRKLASEKSSPLIYNSDNFFHPVKIEGDWLQVKWDINGNWNYGWVRWKKDDTILIEFFYFA